MKLAELRRTCRKTQVALAQSLSVNQGEISKIEHRTDVYLSTLTAYVEALGGRLEVRAVFRNRNVRISQYEEATGYRSQVTGRSTKRTQPKRLEAGG